MLLQIGQLLEVLLLMLLSKSLVAGSLLEYVWFNKSPRTHKQYMIVVASGFVLGEGVTSILTALFKTAGVGVWTCAGCIQGLCSGC